MNTKVRRILEIDDTHSTRDIFKGNDIASVIEKLDDLRAKYAEYSVIYRYDVQYSFEWNSIRVKVWRPEHPSEIAKREAINKKRIESTARNKAIKEAKKAEEQEKADRAMYEKLKAKYG